MKETRIVCDEGINYKQNGLLHRENGPAVIHFDGYVSYLRNGDLHREDGPAIIWPSGIMSYYKNGVFIKVVES